jgi:hypothetical protein
MRVPERSDGIKSLLIGHDEQDVRLVGCHFLFKQEVPRRRSSTASTEKMKGNFCQQQCQLHSCEKNGQNPNRIVDSSPHLRKQT